MKYFILTTLLLLFRIIVSGQTKEQAFFYVMKIYNETIESNIRPYGVNFDESNYALSINNEFERNSYFNIIKPKIENGLNSVDFNKVFAFKSSAELGEYDFSTGSFPVKMEDIHFKWVYRSNLNDNFGTSIQIAGNSINWNELIFDLSMSEDKGREFISKKTQHDGKVDRSVYAKIIYSIVNRRSGYSGYKAWIICYIYRIEFYEDPDLTNRIGTIIDNSNYYDKINGVRMKEGEEIIYYKDNTFQDAWIQTNNKNEAKYYRVIKYSDGKITSVKNYYITGKIQMEGSFGPYCAEDRYRNGISTWYWENGFKMYEVNYIDGNQEGCYFRWDKYGVCSNGRYGDFMKSSEIVRNNKSCICEDQKLRYLEDDVIKNATRAPNWLDTSKSELNIIDNLLEAESIHIEKDYDSELSNLGASGAKKIVYDSGDVYEGEVKNGLKDGFGKMIYSNGSTYEGYWTADKKGPKGMMTWTDSKTYNGEYSNDSRSGKGAYYEDRGRGDYLSYEGFFMNDMYEGQGELKGVSGGMPWSFVGVFKNGKKFNGQWQDTNVSGQTLVVEYKNGRMGRSWIK